MCSNFRVIHPTSCGSHKTFNHSMKGRKPSYKYRLVLQPQKLLIHQTFHFPLAPKTPFLLCSSLQKHPKDTTALGVWIFLKVAFSTKLSVPLHIFTCKNGTRGNQSWINVSRLGKDFSRVCDVYIFIWLVVSTPLKNISQNGNLP